MRGHTHRVFGVAFRPDGKQIASGSWDGTIRTWDAETVEMRAVLPAQVDQSGEVDYIWGIDYSPDGRRIAAGTWQAIRIWNLETQEIDLEIAAGDEMGVWDVDFSPDGRRIVSAAGAAWFNRRKDYRPGDLQPASVPDQACAVDVWDTSTGERVMELRGHADRVWCVEYSPDGRWILSASDDGTARLWDARTGETLRECRQNLPEQAVSAEKRDP